MDIPKLCFILFYFIYLLDKLSAWPDKFDLIKMDEVVSETFAAWSHMH